ncbi:MAG TPA: LLM class F420-dependent oxidoreductase [Ktedonobacteraceae bacterium]|nr:LLM class F420-dependent oxidoreductase [Ktedonobacteraceae bacterium]
MTMKYGLIVPQGWRMDLVGIPDPVEAYETMTRVAQEADALGYDSIWLYDHFHTVPTPTQEVTFECWTSTAALARDTKRVRIGQMVTCNGYRNPALLAKMASTVDVLSHGRLDFGIGAGWYEDEFIAYGYNYPDGPTRLRQLRDAVQIILKMWHDDRAVFEGQYLQVHGAINQPKGVQKPHIPLLIGGGGEKVTLKLVAQYGDACNIGHLTNEGLVHKFSVIREHCEALGRDYNSIRRTVLYNCAIAETDEEAMAKTEPFQRNIPSGRIREQALVGTPDTIKKRLVEIEQAGAQEIILYMPDAKDLESVRMFAQECIAKA